VAGGDDELDGVTPNGSDAKDSASEESPSARKTLVRFETLYFFE
jgi:hypothetical protein